MSTALSASPLLSRPGAVAGPPPDESVAGHYGDPLAEQRGLAGGAAVVDLSHRPVLRITGADRLSWLHSLTSQHLEALAPGVPVDALVLSPHGHVEHHLALVDDGEAVWAHVEPGTATALQAYLDSVRFLLRVEVSDVSAEHAVVHGPDDLSDGLRLPGPLGPVHLVDRRALAAVVAGRPLAGLDALEALRVAARVPRLGFETDHRTIPNELPWLRTAVHLDKGCYRGQETVARTHNLGRPPRRLVLLHLDGSVVDLPARGSDVLVEGRRVGALTSVARHWELGPIGLALIKRSTDDRAALDISGIPGQIDSGA